MDKSEAYSILNAELNLLRECSKNELESRIGSLIESTEKGKSGVLYSVTVEVKLGNNGVFRVKGKISDFNTQNFELLQEEIVVEIH